jgi:S-ribosylhomocysteine lyase LuxS involved in autoinducer biosynthesis
MEEDNKDKHQYDDIINLQHHVSSNRTHMSILDRAAQFSPFAALTGFDGAIKETARLTDQKTLLDEAAKTILDEKLRIVQEQLSRQQEVEIVFFQPDEKKTGGAYISMIGRVKKIEGYERVVLMQDGTRIPVEDIIDITGDMFQAVDDFFA